MRCCRIRQRWAVCLEWMPDVNCDLEEKVNPTNTVKSVFFWDVTHCSLEDRYQCFGEICCFHLQCRRLRYKRREGEWEQVLLVAFVMLVTVSQITRCHIQGDQYAYLLRLWGFQVWRGISDYSWREVTACSRISAFILSLIRVHNVVCYSAHSISEITWYIYVS
jgi:hypothetical protein